MEVESELFNLSAILTDHRAFAITFTVCKTGKGCVAYGFGERFSLINTMFFFKIVHNINCDMQNFLLIYFVTFR